MGFCLSPTNGMSITHKPYMYVKKKKKKLICGSEAQLTSEKRNVEACFLMSCGKIKSPTSRKKSDLNM